MTYFYGKRNTRYKKSLFGFFFIFFLFQSVSAFSKILSKQSGGQINTATITEATIKGLAHCAHYKIIGACFWLKCDPKCHVDTTLKVDLYNPDAIVSVYNRAGTNPWFYADHVIDSVAEKIAKKEIKTTLGFSMGAGRSSTNASKDQNIHFKEVDIIGNPALWVMRVFSAVIPSKARGFEPYYFSLLDAVNWRNPTLEMRLYPQKLIPGVSEVGNLLHDWGSVFPRTGFVIQSNDAKAAAVLAQRAADIATHAAQPHIYHNLRSGSCGSHCHIWAAKENDPKSIQWQMIYPIQENKCLIFGTNDLMQVAPWGTRAYQKGNGNYSWILWRHYKGCIPHGGKYIGNVSF